MARISEERLKELAANFEDGASVAKLRDRYQLNTKALVRKLVEARRKGLVGEESFATLVLDRTVGKFPQDTGMRLDAVFSCVNNEIKAETILCMDELPMFYADIYKRLSGLTDTALPFPITFYNYCIATLSPIGFLVQEALGFEGVETGKYFKLSPAGKKYGQPIAAFSLNFAAENGVSLYSILGQTASPGDTRAPYNTIRMLRCIKDSSNTVVEIVDKLDMTEGSVIVHLDRLEKAGMVKLQTLSSDYEDEGHSYRWVDGKSPEDIRLDEHSKAVKEVAKWLAANKTGNSRQISEATGCNVYSVTEAFNYLLNNGFVTTAFLSRTKSCIELVDNEAQPFLEYVDAVEDALQDGPALKEMGKLYADFMTGKKREQLNRATGLYRDASPRMNQLTPEERDDKAIEFIGGYQAGHGCGPRNSEILDGLDWNMGTLCSVLSRLCRSGKITKKRDNKNILRYSVRE